VADQDETKRMRITSGSAEFCEALCAYLRSELTFAEVADFQVRLFTKQANYDFQPEGATHEVHAAEGPCVQYTTSLQRTRDVARDFRGGWEAARKPSPNQVQQIASRKPAPKPR
jgi:hypothetical protein